MTPQDSPSTSGAALAPTTHHDTHHDTHHGEAPATSAPTMPTANAPLGVAAADRTGGDGSPGWRAVAAQAGLIWLMTRLVYPVFTYYALLTRNQSIANHGRTEYFSLPANAFLTSWGQGDAAWYVNIARQGYWTPHTAPFFPLYPVLTWLASFLVGGHTLVAGMLVANLGSLGAFLALGLLVAHERERRRDPAAETTPAITRTLLAFAAYPLAFLLVAAYSDGLSLALIFAALLCARRGAWRWAAGWAALAGLTQPLAIILVAPLLWEFGRQRGWFSRLDAHAAHPAHGQASGAAQPPTQPDDAPPVNGRRPGKPTLSGALAVVAAPLTSALYLLFIMFRFGNPFVAFESLNAVGQVSGFLSPAGSFMQARALADLALVVIALALTLASVRRAPVTYTLFMAGLLLICLFSGAVTGSDPALNAGRYLLAAAPCFLLLGRWMERRPWFDLLIIGGGFTLQAICALLFLWGGWVA